MAIPDSQQYPSKLCLIKYGLDIKVHYLENWLFSIVDSLQKYDLLIFTAGKHKGIIRLKHFLIEKKRHYLPRNWSDKGFKVTVVY